MNPPSWVLDTNIVVSGLLVAAGFSGRLLDAILAGRLRISYDDRIEAEYREVLARPRFAISPERREAILAELKNQDHVLAELWTGPALPDADDLPFLEVARHTADRLLVTGNFKHFPPAVRGPVTVLSPRDAWTRLAARV
jgi:predicted nucleic acid-binding protein